MNKAWADADPARAQRFLVAYYLGVEWVKQHRDQAAEVAAAHDHSRDPAAVKADLADLTWHGPDRQRSLMGPGALLGLAEAVLRILVDEAKTLPAAPALEKWVGGHLLP